MEESKLNKGIILKVENNEDMGSMSKFLMRMIRSGFIKDFRIDDQNDGSIECDVINETTIYIFKLLKKMNYSNFEVVDVNKSK